MPVSNQVSGCHIWQGFPAVGYSIPQQHEMVVEDSPRAGGGYAITYEAKIRLASGDVDDSIKPRLTTSLIDQRLQGERFSRVTTDSIRRARAQNPLPVHLRADRLLRYLASQSMTIGDSVNIGRYRLDVEYSKDSYGSPLYPEAPNSPGLFEAMAYTESTSPEEVYYLANYITEMGWARTVAGIQYYSVEMTVLGHGRVADEARKVDTSQAFVAMWLDDSMKSMYEEAIEPAIRKAGYEPMLISQKEHINKIEDEIIAEIRRSRFVVADFTHNPDDGIRGSVYYEAGFAHGLDLPVIFACKHDQVEDLHFDTSHYSHITWTAAGDLREQLVNRIRAVVGQGPLQRIDQ